jgi:hypothetical protein
METTGLLAILGDVRAIRNWIAACRQFAAINIRDDPATEDRLQLCLVRSRNAKDGLALI